MLFGRKSTIAAHHSRRWEANFAAIRRAHAKLDPEKAAACLQVEPEELAAVAQKNGLTEALDVRVQSDSRALIAQLRRFFEQAVLESSDQPKEGLVLPREIVYHN